MLQQSPARAAAPDIDWRLLAPLLANAVMVHTVIGIIRVTTSYRTIELDLPIVWLGVISAGFALLPVFSAVALGRFIDRGNDSRAAWIGAALILASAAGFWAWSASGLHLLAFTVVLGFGHMFCMASHQMLAVRCANMRGREAAFGHYMVAVSTGQGLGPFIVGWLRVFYARLIVTLGRRRLTLVSISVAAAAFGVLAVPSLPLMYLAIITVGLGLGIASTTTLSGIVDLAPRGSARHRLVAADHRQSRRPGAGAFPGEPDRGRNRHGRDIARDRVHLGGFRNRGPGELAKRANGK